MLYLQSPSIQKLKSYTSNYMNYQLEETIVGTWFDNKPVYRKMFTDIEYKSDGTLSSSIDMSDVNIDTVVNLFGCRYVTTSKNCFIGNSTALLSYNTGNKIIQGQSASQSVSAGVYKFIVIEYTKV